jgi:hypothetical protein
LLDRAVERLGKWVLNFSEPAEEISPVVLDKAG